MEKGHVCVGNTLPKLHSLHVRNSNSIEALPLYFFKNRAFSPYGD
ncbi:MAG: hypothetical protein Ct9H300mP9_1200 [Candidatus Neomarinimicrobiota bacterium]|nr:MAG: hypothetical protein Ct9H300mP9_1200 [Candidatus Neomarinimicrobiota bacterium]